MCLSPITPESGYMPRWIRESHTEWVEGCHTSCQSFRHGYQIRTDTVSVVCQVRTSPSKAALYLISNEKNIVLLTKLLNLLQVTRRRHDNAAPVSQASTYFEPDISPCRALDWLNHEGGNPLTVRLEGVSDVVNVTKSYFPTSGRYWTDIWHKWPKNWWQSSDTFLPRSPKPSPNLRGLF